MRSTVAASKLVRLLGAHAPVERDAAGMDFAERLSLWLDAFDAIRLQSAHQAIRAIERAASGAAPAHRATRGGSVAQDLQRVRGTLASAVAQDPLALAGVAAADASYAPFHQRHLELQRQMELMIAPLREHVRNVLARTSPALRQLAALDAVLEDMLAPREQSLLPTAVTLLERRFAALREAAGDDAGWLGDFTNEWRETLLAELDLRLEPVAGLADALGSASNDLQ